MRRPGLQIAALTALFAALYFGIRTVPVSSCTFLHYDQTQVTENGVELCAPGASSFIDVSRLPFPVKLSVKAVHPPAVGETARYTLQVSKDDGTVLRPSEFALTHTRKLHLLVIDPTLDDYQHIHPEPVGDAGDWTFDFTPRASGIYRVFAEFVPAITRRQVVTVAEIVVPGKGQAGILHGLAPYSDGDYRYTLTTSGGPLNTGTDESLRLKIQNLHGGDVKLEPVMGALGHVVAFDAARRGYAHLHPLVSGLENDRQQPELAFLMNTSVPGRYRVWGQLRIDGRERFVPFDLDVKE